MRSPPPDITFRQLVQTLYERSGLEAELARMTHGSPLRQWRLGIVVAIVLPIVLILLLISSHRVRQGAPYWFFLIALGLTRAAAFPAQWLIRRLDTAEPEPWWLLSGARWYGSALSLGVAFLFEITTERLLTIFWGFEFTSNLQTSLLHPLGAEIAKGAALLLLVWLLRNEFNGVLDGITYGAFIGLGYLSAMTTLMMVQVYLDTGTMAALKIVVWRFVLLGINDDTLWTALFGAAVGFAMQTRRPRLKIAVPLAGLLLSILANVLAQTFGIEVFRQTLSAFGYAFDSFDRLGQIPLGKVWLAAVTSTLLTQLPCYLLLFGALWWSRRWERHMIAAELQGEIGTSSITDAEYRELQAGRPYYRLSLVGWITTLQQRQLLRELLITRRWQQIRWLQVELAFQKWRVARDGADANADHLVSLLRKDIAMRRTHVGQIWKPRWRDSDERENP